MFADIAGFTAWSSEREPSQVFQLLEPLYAGFDAIAKRIGVFKVETIGDCYMAVTGLPDPNKAHAVTMAHFSAEIRAVMRELMKDLEVALGPGTSDLRIRIGMHSGPVTAGVLRGQKSRFQLFGDTVNTSSRMESMGQAGRIQVSQATADLLIEGGFQDWLLPREEPIHAKGKGRLETYWLDPPRQGPLESAGISRDPSSRRVTFVRRVSLDSSEWKNLGNCDAMKSTNFSKRERLIDWNTDVLLGLLAKVHAYHTTGGRHQRLSVSSALVTGTSDGISIVSQVREVISLPEFDQKATSNHFRVDASVLDPCIRTQLRAFVAKIASRYRDNMFHNFEHASHVALSAIKLMKRIIAPDDFDYSQRKTNTIESELHYSTFGISSDPLSQFCVVLGALIHDVDHLGVPNATLCKEKDVLAIKYENKSVAEQHSAQLALAMIEEEPFNEMRACIYSTEAQRARFWQLMINIVMATDIENKELQKLRKNRWDKAFDLTEGTMSPRITERMALDDINRKATIVIEHIMQASDVAYTMQHWHIYCKWNKKLFQEMCEAFTAGRADREPAEFWYRGEIGFFDDYVIPLAKKLKECGVFGVSGDECLQYALGNREEWVVKGEGIVAAMYVERNKKLALPRQITSRTA